MQIPEKKRLIFANVQTGRKGKKKKMLVHVSEIEVQIYQVLSGKNAFATET